MSRRGKLRAFIFLGIAVVAIALLSAGLSELELLPGRPLPIGSSQEESAEPIEAPPWAKDAIPVTRTVIIVVALFLPLAIIYALLSPEMRKRVLTTLLHLIPILVILYLLMQAQANFLSQEEQEPPPQELPEAPVGEPIPEFTATPSQWLILTASGGAALLLAALLVGAIWLVWRLRRRPPASLERLAQEAEDTIEAIQGGADLKDTVLRCYYEMSMVLRQQRGIRRHFAMTPREFESSLEQAGLPGEEVGRLTRLFEMVRYGARVAGEEEERQAIACLTAIVEFCRSAQ